MTNNAGRSCRCLLTANIYFINTDVSSITPLSNLCTVTKHGIGVTTKTGFCLNQSNMYPCIRSKVCPYGSTCRFGNLGSLEIKFNLTEVRTTTYTINVELEGVRWCTSIIRMCLKEYRSAIRGCMCGRGNVEPCLQSPSRSIQIKTFNGEVICSIELK